MHSDFENRVVHNGDETFRGTPAQGWSAMKKLQNILQEIYSGEGEYPLTEFSFSIMEDDFLIFDRNSVYIYSVPLDAFTQEELDWIVLSLNIFNPEGDFVSTNYSTVEFTHLRDDEYLVWRVPTSDPVLLGALLHDVLDDKVHEDLSTLIFNVNTIIPYNYKYVDHIEFDFDSFTEDFSLALDEHTTIVGLYSEGNICIIQDDTVEDSLGTIFISEGNIVSDSFEVGEGSNRVLWNYNSSSNCLSFSHEYLAEDILDSYLPNGLLKITFVIDTSDKLVFHPRKDKLIISDKEMEGINDFIRELIT